MNSVPLYKTSLLPIANASTRILILGTMPGDLSLKLNEYYANPRNRFWKIISSITNSKLPDNYTDKTSLLLMNNMGLWDVLKSASRKGSLDNDIKNEKPNDLEAFIKMHKNLKIIIFNGKVSERLYDKYFIRNRKLLYYSLPSTSPANTNFDFNTIYQVWSEILRK